MGDIVDWKLEWRWFALMVAVFLGVFYLPVGAPRFDAALLESLYLVKW